MPKPQKKNAFFMFMCEYKKDEERHGRKFPNGMRDVQADPQCNEIWRAMTPQEKDVYRNMAKNHAIESQVHVEKKTCTGIPVSYFKRLQQEKERFEEAMNKYIMSTVSANINPCEVASFKFYFIHTNIFCVRQIDEFTFDYFPAEFALLEFSLADGIGKTYHEILNCTVPTGYHRSAVEHSQRTHQIPLGLSDGESDYLLMFSKLQDFLKDGMVGTKFPPLFTTERVKPMVLALLKRMTEAAGVDRDAFLVYSVEVLYNQFVNVALMNRGEEEVIEVPLPVAKSEFGKDPFAYCVGLECLYHNNLDATLVYCSLSVVKRWGLMICDWCCGMFNIEMIPGKHFHKKEDDEGLLSTALARLNVRPAPPIDTVLSETGVSEAHRIRKSERTCREEQARREFSQPVEIIRHRVDGGPPETYIAGGPQTYERPLRYPTTHSRAMDGANSSFNFSSDMDKFFPPLGRGQKKYG